jgi:hypothetical protein
VSVTVAWYVPSPSVLAGGVPVEVCSLKRGVESAQLTSSATDAVVDDDDTVRLAPSSQR